jgi:hypothetical protein
VGHFDFKGQRGNGSLAILIFRTRTPVKMPAVVRLFYDEPPYLGGAADFLWTHFLDYSSRAGLADKLTNFSSAVRSALVEIGDAASVPPIDWRFRHFFA